MAGPARARRGRAAAALPLVAAALVLLLAGAIVPAAAADAGPVPGRYIIFYKQGTSGLKAKTAEVGAAAARSLAGDGEAAAALARASGPAGGGALAGPGAAAAALAEPFEYIVASKHEADSLGRPLPSLHAVVQLKRGLHGRAAERAGLTKRIVAAIQAHPDVASVVPDQYMVPRTACGPNNKFAKCPSDANKCCRADGVCGDTADHCGDKCMAEYGTCPYNTLARRTVLNSDKFVKDPDVTRGVITPWSITDATGYDPVKKKYTVPFLLDKTLKVMVMEPGGGGPHPDLNIARCWNSDPDPAIVHDNKTECHDLKVKDQHGTHVAGIVGARNNGFGTWGTAENVPIFMVKASSYAAILAGLEYLAATGDDKVAVVNMSFGFEDNGSGARTPICNLMVDIASRFGTIFVVAAGNAKTEFYGDVFLNDLPTSCPNSVVVTNMESCTKTATGRACVPRAKSNWLRNTESDDIKAQFVTAPGTNIWSTGYGISYKFMSGTSQAAPHVAGIFARCFATKDCTWDETGTSADLYKANRAKVIGYFKARMSDPKWLYSADGLTYTDPVTKVVKYMGPMAWGGHW